MLISGLPGKMASAVLLEAKNPENRDLFVLPFALTGGTVSEKDRDRYLDGGISLIATGDHEDMPSSLLPSGHSDIIAIDFTTPGAALANASLYCKHRIPFVMGTTMPSEVREKIDALVVESGNFAVIAPNMSAPIVLMQSMLEWAAQEFPGTLDGLLLNITESHQAGKRDTSGTARALMAAFNTLGARFFGSPFTEANIEKIRDPEEQRSLGVPEAFLGGHGWHTYSLDSDNGAVHLELVHNVNGRKTYAEGALRAVRFLAAEWVFEQNIRRHHTATGKPRGESGRVFSMTDVLRARK